MSIAASPLVKTRASTARHQSGRAPRVLHVINGEDYSGAERVQDLLGLRLPQFGFDPGYVCVKPGRFPTVREAQATPLNNVRMSTKFDVRPAWRIARLIREGDYDVVHTHTPRSLLIGRLAAAWTGVPVVHHVQCPAAADTTHAWRNRINALLERNCMRGVSRVIAVSESLRSYLHNQGVSDARIATIPNAVPIHGPLPARATPTDFWTIGICAMFRPRKGIHILLEAMAMLRAAGINVRLNAVGYFKEPDYERQVKQQVANLGLGEFVHWKGFSENVYDELDGMDLFVLPSLFGEGLPLAILEAMAAGVPVVSTNVEGTPEAVRDGVDGVIVEPGDAHQLAKGFQRIIQGELDWQALRASAHQRQAELYSDTALARKVAHVYETVLSKDSHEAATCGVAIP